MEPVKFFCINLDTRKDRWRSCIKQFAKQGIKVQRWSAKPLPENRRFGAGLSHREIINYAKKNDWAYVGVLEDDIIFMRDDFSSFVGESLKVLEKKKWYILYFGGMVCRNAKLRRDVGVKGLFLIQGILGTHAVIYNKDFYDIYLQLHPDKYSESTPKLYLKNKYRALDEWMAWEFQNNFPCYMTEYFLAGQGDSFSNIENKLIRGGNSHAILRFNIYKYGFGWLGQIGGKIKDLFKKPHT